MVPVLGCLGAVLFVGMATAPFGHDGSINPFPPKLPISELSIYAGGTEQVAKGSPSSLHNPALVPLRTGNYIYI